jgi:hypothetical protein
VADSAVRGNGGDVFGFGILLTMGIFCTINGILLVQKEEGGFPPFYLLKYQ